MVIQHNLYSTWRYGGHRPIWCSIVPKGKEMCVTSSIRSVVFTDWFFQCVDAFVDELRWEERDSAKCDKIRELKLTSEEWERVKIFLGLLSVCLPFCMRNKAWWALARWQCPTCIFLQERSNTLSHNTGTWSPSQGVVESSHSFAVSPIHCCPWCRMWKDWWVLCKNYRVSGLYPIHEYKFPLCIMCDDFTDILYF